VELREYGTTGEFILIRADGTELKLPSKCKITIYKGDTLIIRTPGGGGYGDVLERDPYLIREDILNGLVSPEAAINIYGFNERL
jgi:N-methylhydantoinase B